MRNLLTLLAILGLALQACSPLPQHVEDPVRNTDTAVEQHQSDSGVPNFQGIADAIACVFAPDSCER